MQRDELDQVMDDPIVHHVRSRQVGPTAASRWAIATAWVKALELEARLPSTIRRSLRVPT
jgi:hypothetical protein